MWSMQPTTRPRPRHWHAIVHPVDPYGAEQTAQVLYHKYAQIAEQAGGDLRMTLAGPYAALVLTLPDGLAPDKIVDTNEGLNWTEMQLEPPPSTAKATQAPMPHRRNVWYADVHGFDGFSDGDWAQKLLLEHQQNCYDHDCTLLVQSPRDGAGKTKLVLHMPESMHPHHVIPEDQFLMWHMADQPKDWITAAEERDARHRQALQDRENGI